MKNTPRYLVITQDIINQIQEGKLHSGDQLMTEAQLCEKYDVSRMTVNKALTALVTKGFIRRVSGKGTFIRDQEVTNTSEPCLPEASPGIWNPSTPNPAPFLWTTVSYVPLRFLRWLSSWSF